MPSNHYLHLESPVARVRRCSNGKLGIEVDGQQLESFHHVVLAVHANLGLKILGESTTTSEQSTLQHFLTTENVCYLHSDESVSYRSVLILQDKVNANVVF